MARKWKNKQLELSKAEVKSLVEFFKLHKDDENFEDLVIRWSQASGIGTTVDVKIVKFDNSNIPETVDVSDWKNITDYDRW